ncbi:hypothetical protein GCM10010149_68530 [Nonomuraea roseoviolacea subsp. roseoviolacea]|uniref:hypothetical protein n=1 Tax=Nonomuraea roseoviolacea TaxID=103837 RepID=UPI0031E07FE9
MSNASNGDDFTETAYALHVQFNPHHRSGSTHPPRPKQWAHVTDLGRHPFEVEQELRKYGIDDELFDHFVYVVPADDYDPSQQPRGYKTFGPIEFEATPNEIAKIRAAAAEAGEG